MSCNNIRSHNSILNEEKKLYNATIFSADTLYCHHLDKNGNHIVLHNLPTSSANNCKGVIYVRLGLAGRIFQCGKQRGGHDICTKERCPFIRDGKTCPFKK